MCVFVYVFLCVYTHTFIQFLFLILWTVSLYPFVCVYCVISYNIDLVGAFYIRKILSFLVMCTRFLSIVCLSFDIGLYCSVFFFSLTILLTVFHRLTLLCLFFLFLTWCTVFFFPLNDLKVICANSVLLLVVQKLLHTFKLKRSCHLWE